MDEYLDCEDFCDFAPIEQCSIREPNRITPEEKHQYVIKRRERMNEDPEYAKKMRETWSKNKKKYIESLKKNPEKYKEYRKKINDEKRVKYKLDEEYRKKTLETNRLLYKTNSEFRNRIRKRRKELYLERKQKHINNPSTLG